MKAIRINSNYAFYVKALFTIFLIASLAFLQTPSVTANGCDQDENGNDHGHGVPGQASIEVSKTVDSVTSLPGVGFGIDKFVDKSSITLNPGENTEVTYTINVIKSTAEQTSYELTGQIVVTASEDNDNDALVTKVEDAVEYHADGPDWTEVRRITVFSAESPNEDHVPLHGSKTYNYGITFTAPEGANTWRNVAYVTISNRGGEHPEEPYHDREDFELPDSNGEGPSEVLVSDEESLSPDNGSVGFAVTSVKVGGTDSADLVGPWTVTPPETITIQKTVTASDSAATGTSYILHNTAAIVETDIEDSTDVAITIPTPPSSGGGEQPSGGQPLDGGQPTSTGGGGGGGGGTEQAATVTTEAAPAPAPEQVAALPAVVTPPAAAPEVVTQAKPAAIPKKLPFTGLNFWYLSLAVLLIMAGSLLQLVQERPRHLRRAK